MNVLNWSNWKVLLSVVKCKCNIPYQTLNYSYGSVIVALGKEAPTS